MMPLSCLFVPAMLIGFKLISNFQGKLVMDFYENIKLFIKKICNETEGKLAAPAQKRNKFLYFHFDAREVGHFIKPVRNSPIYYETETFSSGKENICSSCLVVLKRNTGNLLSTRAVPRKKTIKHAVIKFAFAIFSLLPRCFFEREFFRPSFNQTYKRKSTLK